MRTVKVLTTGGTIATRTDVNGKAVARATGHELMGGLVIAGVDVGVEDVFRVGSFLMTLQRVHELTLRAHRVLGEGHVSGVVVTHGTDTLEETALFMDLFIESSRPIVLTGAQRPADAPDSDGPRNLRDAILVAAQPSAEGLGALIVFDGNVFPARGTHKVRTLESSAFASSIGPIGWIHSDAFHVTSRLQPRPRLDLEAFDPSRARVDIVPCYPDADATAIRALASAGARGIVLEGTGAGNANLAICTAVESLTDAGIVVATSTRVPAGPVAPIYGDGGGADLFRAGAVPMGVSRPSHARVLLAALLGVERDAAAVRRKLAQYVGE